MRILLFTLLTSFFTSCAYHDGMLQSDVSITSANFQVKNFVQGTSSTTLVFGIGGLNKRNLIFDAKKDLYNNYQLKENEVFANFTIDQKTSFLPIVSKQRVTITAEVIEFVSSENRFDKEAVDQLMTSKVDRHSFKVGDQIGIYDGEFRKGTITSFDGKKVEVTKDSASREHYIVRLHELYYSDVNLSNSQRFGQQIGDEITFFATKKRYGEAPSSVIANKNKHNKDKLEGEIIGLNKNSLIVKSEKYSYKIDYIDILK